MYILNFPQLQDMIELIKIIMYRIIQSGGPVTLGSHEADPFVGESPTGLPFLTLSCI